MKTPGAVIRPPVDRGGKKKKRSVCPARTKREKREKSVGYLQAERRRTGEKALRLVSNKRKEKKGHLATKHPKGRTKRERKSFLPCKDTTSARLEVPSIRKGKKNSRAAALADETKKKKKKKKPAGSPSAMDAGHTKEKKEKNNPQPSSF